MAIARDNFQYAGVVTGTNPYTASYTVTGSNTFLYVAILNSGTPSATVTSITYNGVAMVPIDVDNSNVVQTETVYTFGLMGASTGSNTLSVTMNTTIAGGAMSYFAQSYTGVSQTGQPEAHAHNSSAGTTSLTESVTVLTNNAWLTGFARTLHTFSAGTNTFVLGSADNDNGIDSNSAQSTGSQSMTINQSPSAGAFMFVVSIAPVGAGPSTKGNFLSFM